MHDKGGAACIFHLNSKLITYEMRSSDDVISPFHMETTTLLLAIERAVQMQVETCVFYSDSLLLVKFLNQKECKERLQIADWRSYAERICNIVRVHKGYQICYVPREENEKAHYLANVARTEQFSYMGFTYPLFLSRN